MQIFQESWEITASRKDQIPTHTAVEFVQAYCKTAAIAQQINNCLHEIMFDKALNTAQELDKYRKETGSVKGPLHGLPISLKDQFHVEGYDTTMGYVGWVGTYEDDRNPTKVHKVNSQSVEELLSLGAVLYCKTSLPQTLLLGETVNNIIGTTLNPLRRSWHGYRWLCPDPGKLLWNPLRNVADLFGSTQNPGQDTYASSVGVMGTTIDAVKLVMSSILSTEPWLRDPGVIRMPWNFEMEKSTIARAKPDGSANQDLPFKFGVFWTDGVVGPQPLIRRGLRLLHDLLKSKGHKVVDWNPPSQSTAKEVHAAFLKADGAHDVQKQLQLSGEPLVPLLRNSFQLHYWNSTASEDGQIVDAVIMSVAPYAAVIPGKFYHPAYTECINLMDYSVAVIPVTKADKSIDLFDNDYTPLNEKDKRNRKSYDPEIYDGAPVGLQIVARKHEEEKVWANAKIVDSALKTMG
ncbi:hypothetical protein JMJ35_005254 [Cladonia borealis]|uniref:Amidase domain-containing protein n=1 Tax=Cladonia borealis TaxID=184061 RepID=A0AA39UA64_9LECA|nr:hypothetical protein JMJ35_005254 [Cladonia borealis]